MEMNQRQVRRSEINPDEIDLDFLMDSKLSLSVTTDRMRLLSLTKYYGLIKDPRGLCKTYEDFYELETSLLSRNNLLTSRWYLSGALTGLLAAYLKIGEVNKAKTLFEKEWKLENNKDAHTYFNSIRTITYDAYENYLYYCSSHSQIQWHVGEYKKGADLLKKESERLNNPALRLKFATAFYETWKYKILLEYAAGQYRDAMMSINEMESMNIKKTAPIMFKDCQWMKLLMQFRLGNHTVVQNLSANLLKNKKTFAFSAIELACLAIFKKSDAIQGKGLISKIKSAIEGQKGEIKIFEQMDIVDALTKFKIGK
jgi:hypothetical protein